MYANLCLAQYQLLSLSYIPFLVTISNFQKSYKIVKNLSQFSCNIDVCPPWVQRVDPKFSEPTLYHALNEMDDHGSRLTNINTFIKKWWNKNNENDIFLPNERGNRSEFQKLQFSQLSSKVKNPPGRGNIIEWAKSYQIYLASKAALYFTASIDCPTNSFSYKYPKIYTKTNLFEINDKLAQFQRDMGAHVICIILDKHRFEGNLNKDAQKTVYDRSEKSKIDLKQIFEDVNASLMDPYTYDSIFKCESDSGLHNSYTILAQSPEGQSEHLFRTYLPSFVMLIHRYYDTKPPIDLKTDSNPGLDHKVFCHLNVGDNDCHTTEFACLSKYGSCETKKKSFNSNYLTQQATQHQNLTDAHNKFATIHSSSYDGDAGKSSKGHNPDNNAKRPSLFSLFSNPLASNTPKKCELIAASQEALTKSEPPSPETNRLFWVGSFNEGSLGGLAPSRPLIKFKSRDLPTNGVTLCCQELIRWEYSNLKRKFLHQSAAPFTTHYFYDKALGQTYVICNLEYNHIFLLIVLPGEVNGEYLNSSCTGKVFKESSLENNPGTGEDALNYTKHASLRNFLLYNRQKLDSSLEIEKLAGILAP